MSPMSKARPLRGALIVPGDKAISHRAAILAALAGGVSVIRGFSPAGDCQATLDVLRDVGTSVRSEGDMVTVEGRVMRPPAQFLDCRRSGTTMRLLCGALAAMPFESVLSGDFQLLRRPMERVAAPLRLMGADVRTASGGVAPIRLRGGRLHGIDHELPVASAQVKSALLLAGLFASGTTTVREPVPTRDHTERLLSWLGASVERSDGRVSIAPGTLPPFELEVPGDMSSAAPLLAAAAMVPGSDLVVDRVGLNPGRTGFLRVLTWMGADVEVEPDVASPEPLGRVRVRYASLRSVMVGGSDVPSIIDELPLVGVLATQADGVSEIRGAGELRVKESDRIAGLVSGLRALGADAWELPDGFAVRGPSQLSGGECDAGSDHRMAMAFCVAGLVAKGPVAVRGMGSVVDSFPAFSRMLEAAR